MFKKTSLDSSVVFCNQSRAKTDKTMQFPPEIISTKLSKLLRHYIIERLVVLGYIIDIPVVADGLEVTAGALYLAIL